MLIHPNIDPVAVHLGPIAIRWYALSYLLGFALFIVLGRYRIRRGNTAFTTDMLEDLLTWGILGVILGGRLGYILFYQPSYYLAHPLEIFKVWEGGMSFHGGFLGVLVVSFLFARRHGISFVRLIDFIAPLAPLGLASGRILGNFINGELWGRVTDPKAFWAMGFQGAHSEDMQYVALHPDWLSVWQQYGMLPRHPSPLYEGVLEGLVLFVILWLFSAKPRPKGQVAALFVFFYGLFRFVCEFAREPDSFLGFLALGLSMGQWLSLPLIAVGLAGFVWAGKAGKTAQNPAPST